MPDLTKWDELAIKAILSNKDFEIKEVENYEPIKALIFDRAEYSSIISLIQNRDWKTLQSFNNTEKNVGGEFLDIIRFSTSEGTQYIATIYDSNELWQDPEVIEIIPLS